MIISNSDAGIISVFPVNTQLFICIVYLCNGMKCSSFSLVFQPPKKLIPIFYKIGRPRPHFPEIYVTYKGLLVVHWFELCYSSVLFKRYFNNKNIFLNYIYNSVLYWPRLLFVRFMTVTQGLPHFETSFNTNQANWIGLIWSPKLATLI